MADFFAHPTALVESDAIGERTRIWAFAHVMPGAVIGADCNIGDHCFIESGVVIGRGVTIKNGVAVWEGVRLEDGVFVGPNAVFTNDLRMRSPRLPIVRARYADKSSWLQPTLVGVGAAIGANATILCGVTIGAWAMIAAGAVVTCDVPPHALMVGAPARLRGFVCACAEGLQLTDPEIVCARCQRHYHRIADRIEPVEPITLWEDSLS